MRVFDHKYNVKEIDRKDVVNIKWNNKQLEYHTETIVYFGASNVKEELELENDESFFLLDKNNSINMNYIERFVEGGVFVNGTLFKLSNMKIVLLKRQLRKYLSDSQ